MFTATPGLTFSNTPCVQYGRSLPPLPHFVLCAAKHNVESLAGQTRAVDVLLTLGFSSCFSFFLFSFVRLTGCKRDR